VLKRFDGDSGEALWALDLSFVRLGLQFIGLEPLVDSKCDRGCNSLSDLCKAELVIKLLRLGWVKVAAKPDPYKAGGLKQLWSARVWSSRWYLIVMLSSRQVWGKGLVQIEHDRPEAYFKCCFYLSDMSKIKALDEKGRLKSEVYMKALSDKLTPEELAALDGPLVGALADGDGPVDAAFGALGDAVDLPLVALPAAGAGGAEDPEADEMWHDRCRPQAPVDTIGRLVSIKSDGFSHTTHMQRAYLDCHVKHADGLQCH
jgi:hypothetical protein